MPAMATHYLFGQDVYKALIRKNIEIAEIVKNNKKDYNVGLQGPDLLFYYMPYKKNHVNEYGGEIHKLGGLIFLENALSVLKKEKIKKDLFPEYENYFDRILAYVLGFINHYTLDSNAHPVINELAEYNIINHIKMETELDREMLLSRVLDIDAKRRRENYIKKHSKKSKGDMKISNENKLSTFSIDFYSPIPSVKPHDIQRHKFVEFDKGLDIALKDIYKEITQKEILESLNSFVKYNKMLYSPTGLNVKFLKLLEKTIGKYERFTAVALVPKRYKEQINNARKIIPIYNYSIDECVDNILNFWEALFEDKELTNRFNKDFS